MKTAACPPRRPLLVVLALLTLAAGCRDSNRDSDRRAAAAAAAAQPRLRVLHASPDAPPVDVLVDGAAALTSVPFQAGSGYLPLPAGPHRLQVNAAGTTTTVIDVTPTLESGRSYTAIAVGDLAAIEPLLLEDTRAPVTPGQTRLRVVHAAPAAGPVDVYLTAPGADLTGLAPTLDDVPFKAATAQLEVPAGDWQVRITAAAGGAPVFDTGTIALPPGADLCLAAVQALAGASPVTLVALTDDAAAPTLTLADRRALVRVVHASPDAPAVDVLVDGAVALSGVPYRAASGYLEVDQGARRVQVNPASTTTSVIDATLSLERAKAYTVLAVDRVASIGALVLEDDRSAPAPGNVRVRLVHASPSAGTVDVYVTGPNDDLNVTAPTIAGFAFQDGSAYLEVPAGTYRVRVALGGTKTVAIDTGPLSLAAGAVATGIALDPAPGSSSFSALLLADR